MATDKQITANRENAKHSTGPRTECGKRRSRSNAFRHGLTAETIIDVLENAADYEAFAAAINADYRPATNFELELVARLISLLWRLRRAIAIESGLISIQRKSLRERRMEDAHTRRFGVFYTASPSLMPSCQLAANLNGRENDDRHFVKRASKINIARPFMRVDKDVFERLGRYEMRLWRQAIQTILLLNSINRGSREIFGADERRFHLRGTMAKHRHVLWPPFVT